MKKLNYILLLIFGIVLLSSCKKETDDIAKIKDGPNLVAFQSYKINLTGLAENDIEYDKEIYVKVTGPTIKDLTADITVTVEADASSTAIEGKHYRIENKTLVLTKANNYLGVLDVVLVTAGNAPPMDGTPEWESYVAPVLKLNIANATGATNVIPTGKTSLVTLNFTPPNPYAGDYDVELRYFHPSAGGSHPSFPDFNPDDPYGGIRALEKTLTAVTGRKCETDFAVWAGTDLCWITVNVDNSITFEVGDTWAYDVVLGDPFDASKVSHFDPETGVIYLYYHYVGTGGARIFWEVFTPTFK